jgi:E3 ubiquitin-protein ligase DOA10
MYPYVCECIHKHTCICYIHKSLLKNSLKHFIFAVIIYSFLSNVIKQSCFSTNKNHLGNGASNKDGLQNGPGLVGTVCRNVKQNFTVTNKKKSIYCSSKCKP